MFADDQFLARWKIHRITVQYIIIPLLFRAAITAYVGATHGDDAEKNRLCMPNPLTSGAEKIIQYILISQQARAAWREKPTSRTGSNTV